MSNPQQQQPALVNSYEHKLKLNIDQYADYLVKVELLEDSIKSLLEASFKITMNESNILHSQSGKLTQDLIPMLERIREEKLLCQCLKDAPFGTYMTSDPKTKKEIIQEFTTNENK